MTSSTPHARWAAAGPKMSRPANVGPGAGSWYTGLVRLTARSATALVETVRLRRSSDKTSRDEAAPIADKAAFSGLVRWMTGLIVFTMGAFVWAPIPFGLYYKKMTEPTSALAEWAAGHSWVDGSMPLPMKIGLATTPFVISAIAFPLVWRHFAARLGYPNVRTLFRTHAVLFKVMFGVAAVLGLSLVLTARAYSLILFHVVAWYIFAACQFARHPSKSPPQGWWAWMRTSVRGFKTLHVGMVIVLMVIGLVWTIGLDRSSSLAWLLAPESFLYWTIMHITVSFVPR